MLVAEVAKRHRSPTTAHKTNALINFLSQDYPLSPDFTTAGCWADDLKSVGDYMNANWHFIDLPYVHRALFSGLPKVNNESNVAWAIKETTTVLTKNEASLVDMARSLRFMIHFVGDIHQPLHAASMYDDKEFPLPDGDMGGNKFKITGANQSELHAFWDSGANLWPDDPSRPLQPNGTEFINHWATLLETEYPKSSFSEQLKEVDPFEWADESHRLAVTVAYRGVTPGGNISSSYLARGQDTCGSQVALAGYRLAALLNRIFDKNPRVRH